MGSLKLAMTRIESSLRDALAFGNSHKRKMRLTMEVSTKKILGSKESFVLELRVQPTESVISTSFEEDADALAPELVMFDTKKRRREPPAPPAVPVSVSVPIPVLAPVLQAPVSVESEWELVIPPPPPPSSLPKTKETRMQVQKKEPLSSPTSKRCALLVHSGSGVDVQRCPENAGFMLHLCSQHLSELPMATPAQWTGLYELHAFVNRILSQSGAAYVATQMTELGARAWGGLVPWATSGAFGCFVDDFVSSNKTFRRLVDAATQAGFKAEVETNSIVVTHAFATDSMSMGSVTVHFSDAPAAEASEMMRFGNFFLPVKTATHALDCAFPEWRSAFVCMPTYTSQNAGRMERGAFTPEITLETRRLHCVPAPKATATHLVAERGYVHSSAVPPPSSVLSESCLELLRTQNRLEDFDLDSMLVWEAPRVAEGVCAFAQHMLPVLTCLSPGTVGYAYASGDAKDRMLVKLVKRGQVAAFALVKVFDVYPHMAPKAKKSGAPNTEQLQTKGATAAAKLLALQMLPSDLPMRVVYVDVLASRPGCSKSGDQVLKGILASAKLFQAGKRTVSVVLEPMTDSLCAVYAAMTSRFVRITPTPGVRFMVHSLSTDAAASLSSAEEGVFGGPLLAVGGPVVSCEATTGYRAQLLRPLVNAEAEWHKALPALWDAQHPPSTIFERARAPVVHIVATFVAVMGVLAEVCGQSALEPTVEFVEALLKRQWSVLLSTMDAASPGVSAHAPSASSFLEHAETKAAYGVAYIAAMNALMVGEGKASKQSGYKANVQRMLSCAQGSVV